jgi:hypothetical protein
MPCGIFPSKSAVRKRGSGVRLPNTEEVIMRHYAAAGFDEK